MRIERDDRSEVWVLAISVISAIALVGSIAFALVSGKQGPRLVPGEPGPSSPAGRLLTVVSWNICSGTMKWCPSGGQAKVLAGAVSEVIQEQKVDVVFLQEVCSAVVTELRSVLGAEWAVHFRKTRERVLEKRQELLRPERCSESLGDNGLVIGHKSSLGRSDSVSRDETKPVIRSLPLPSPAPSGQKSAHHRLAMCVQLNAVALQFCNAHLPTREEDPTGQLRAAGAEQLAREARFERRLGISTVFGGDLNTRPDEAFTGRPILAPLYEDGIECDPPNNAQATFKGTKIDYLFAGPRFTRIDCFTLQTDRSDHNILVARYRLNSDVESSRDGFPPLLERAYARADHARPNGLLLVDALQRGFNSVEVDVQAPTEDGDFPLGTDRPDDWGRTLEDYYLRPLWRLVRAQHGKVHPESRVPFTLRIDIRVGHPTAAIYEALERKLRPYSEMLSRVEDGEIVTGAVRVVVSNTAVLQQYLSRRSSSLFFVDVRAPWRAGYHGVPSEVFIAMVNVKLADVVGSEMDLAMVTKEVTLAHDLGYAIRFYGFEHLKDSPEIRRIWAALEEAKADFISTDDLDALARVLAG